MTRSRWASVLLPLLASSAGADALQDPAGDTRLRRTDAGANAVVVAPAFLPDLVSVDVTGWVPDDPAADPYSGAVDSGGAPDLVRIKIEFEGLVNPPGPIGLGGLPHDPDRFGPRPVYGFIEFDLDGDPDSGGDDASVAATRFLANAGRFGSLPADVEPDRLVVRPGQADHDFATPPQYERSGADFTLALCGCWDIEVMHEEAPADGRFDSGDTWIVSGRFFERAQGFDCLSFVFGGGGPDGPSGFGLYDPVTEARFSHDEDDGRTTVQVVFPLTPEGAALLAGEPAQPLDFTFGGGNHFSVEEALHDVVLGAAFASGACATLAGDWADTDLHPPPGAEIRPLDPRTWSARAIIGTAYRNEQPDAIYAWTDIGFGDLPGDVDGSGAVDGADADAITGEIEMLDGGSGDADGVKDGEVELPGFGPAFSLFDLDYDGIVGPADLAIVDTCPPDLAEPAGVLDLADIAAFISLFATQNPLADLTGDGVLDLADIGAFISGFLAGCGG